MPLNIAGTVVRSSFLAGLPNSGIVTRGLVLNLDAGNIASYSGSGTSWYDLSSSSNHATLNNGPTWSSTNGGILVFDGANDWFSTPTNAGSANTSFSFGGFIKIVSSPTGPNTFIFGNYTVSTTTPFFALAWNSNGSTVFFYARDASGSPEINSGNGSISLSNNTWYHIICTRDASNNTLNLYVNASLSLSVPFSGSYNLSSSINNFGGMRHFDNYVNGSLGQVVLYNRALNAAEITQNFNSTRNRFGV